MATKQACALNYFKSQSAITRKSKF